MRHSFGLKNHKLAIAAVLSLPMTPLLIGGYFYFWHIRYVWLTPPQSTVCQRDIGILVQAGRIELRAERSYGEFVSDPSVGRHIGPIYIDALRYPLRGNLIRQNLRAIGPETDTIVTRDGSVKITALVIPGWIPLLGCCLAPTLLLRRYIKRRTLKSPGNCPACGYDLRATAEQGGPLLPKCPECGANSPA
jgi:hypothetical protein